jgi:AraC-like DNA-binding protein
VASRDRLRELIDLVVGSLEGGRADGRALAAQASFSRDHLDRLLAAAVGETPVALRRRLLLERAAWQLRARAVAPGAAAGVAGYGSTAAFSRAFARAYGMPPSAFAAAQAAVRLPAPNGIHFHPPAGLLIGGPAGAGGQVAGAPTAGYQVAGAPTAGDQVAGAPAAGDHVAGVPAAGGRGDLTERMVSHHLARVRDLLEAAATLAPAELERPLRPGFVVVAFEGPEPSAALMAERLVFTLEVWNAAIAGEVLPVHDPGEALRARHERAARTFARLARAIRDHGAWDHAFVDALCEPPQSFTYGGVLSHLLAFGAVRREMLASVLIELGAGVPATADPITWEASRRP